MKLAFVLSTQPTRFEAVTFSPDLEPNIARLAALGYDGVELAVREPATLDLAGVTRILDRYHLQVPAIGTGQAWGEEHLSFTDPDPMIRDRAIARILSHIPLARELGAIVILGLIRGKLQPSVTPEEAHAWLVSALESVTRADGQVRFALEPINRYETNLLVDVSETLALVDAVGAANLGVLFDTFHANIEEPDMPASLRACGPRTFHVHVADSNRWAPGAGHIDFSQIVATLREIKYDGWVSAEILAKPDVAQAQKLTARTMKPLLQG